MQQVQIYIEGQRVEMFDYESVVITDTIKDVRDVTKIFTEYSQTFSLPASRTNNKVFQHYYNNDIIDGFDSRIRVPAKLELNSLPFKNGYIKLEGVDLRDNKAHTYRITFFGSTVTLKDLLGDDLLSSLTWLDNFNINYSSANIKTHLTSIVNKTVDSVNYIKPIQVPLITHSERLYYDDSSGHENLDKDKGNLYFEDAAGHKHGVKWNQLKYAIRLEILIKAIEKKYTIANGYSQNLVFSDDFFDLNTSNDFSELYMWLHRTKGDFTYGGQVETYSYTVVDFLDEDNEQSFMSDGVLRLKSFGQTEGANKVLRANLIVDSGSTSVPYSFDILQDGLPVYSSGTVTGDSNNITVPAIINSDYVIRINTTTNIDFSSVSWNYSYFDSETQSTVNETYYSSSSISITPQNLEFSITQQIPKMKVLDFLTAIFRMFNLVAYVEGTEIVVKTLDRYYLEGNSYDITKYIDVSNSQTNSVLPFREIIFGYEGLGSFLAKRHNELFNEEWGTEEYKTENSSIFTGGIYQYKIPFEHMKFERLLNLADLTMPTDIQYGYCVDDKQEPYIGKPLVFYMDLKQASISFVDVVDPDNTIVSKSEITSYFAPANSNLIYPDLENRQSINFSPESDEWELTPNRRSLFNEYHSNYISGIFNKTNRLTKMSAYLPLRLLLKYTLADRFQVAGKSYKINSIETDFKTGKSQLELLSDYAPTVIDLVPPTAPTNLALVQGSQTSSGFEVTWDKSTDNVGVTGYIIDLNQDFYTSVGNVATYEFTGLQGGTDYRVAVFATDAAGNVSPVSNILDTFTLQ
jgi:hypothetical protein